jgi:uncharacterized membrane protein YhaH (DUF805 family)
VDRWFYIGIAVAAIVTVVIGFGPAIVSPARKAPLTPLAATHGIICLAWLLVFLAQTAFAATRRLRSHRRLGQAAAFLAVALIVSGYITSTAMARRGFDLSGDLNAQADPLNNLVNPLADLVVFASLLAAGYCYRNQSEIHKRLMVLATVGGLMPAPLAHLIGHFAVLRNAGGPIIVIPIALFLFASPVYDRISTGRIHRVSLWGAIAVFVWVNVCAVLIGPSTAWHHFAAWLIR